MKNPKTVGLIFFLVLMNLKQCSNSSTYDVDMMLLNNDVISLSKEIILKNIEISTSHQKNKDLIHLHNNYKDSIAKSKIKRKFKVNKKDTIVNNFLEISDTIQ